MRRPPRSTRPATLVPSTTRFRSALSVHADSELVPGAVEVRCELQGPGHGVLRQTMDVCLGDVHHFIELLAGPYALRAVSLSHTPIAPLSVYNRFFGAPVHPAQRHSGDRKSTRLNSSH